jgi:hypothetical protein
MALENYAKGKDGKIVLGSTTFNIVDWAIDEGGSDGDGTHTGSNGIELSVPCTTAYTGSFNLLVNATTPPTATTPKLQRGVEATGKFYISTTKYYEAPIVILTTSVSSTVKDLIKYAVTFQTTAALTTIPS